MQKTLLFLTMLISLNCWSQTVTVTQDGRLQASCPTCPPPTIIYKDTGRIVYKDTGSVRYITLHDTVCPPVIVIPPATRTYGLSFVQKPYKDQDSSAPGRGAEQWHNGYDIAGVYKGSPQDKYYRFSWNHFETGQGAYSWAAFDQQINQAIQAGQKFSFGVMTCCPGCATGWNITYESGNAAYPLYLHSLMQKESPKDWKTGGGDWIPNWNSPTYLSRLDALYKAIDEHIQTGSFNNVRYKDVIGYIDIRGYGAWGEWHSGNIVSTSVNEYPAGTRATVTTLKRIIDIHTTNFQTYPLVAMIAAFDCNQLGIIMNPPEIAYYVLTTRNEWGLIGWRRDQWAAKDAYLAKYLEDNINVYNGMQMNTTILSRYRYAPIVGEPPGWVQTYELFESQIRLYGASSFGNANYGIPGKDLPAADQNYIIAASKACGYRYTLLGGSVSTGDSLRIKLDWSNTGVAPTYENWNIIYEVGGKTFSGKFNPRFTIGSKPITEAFAMPQLGPGTYTVRMKIIDPKGYRKYLPLNVKGMDAAGYLDLTKITLP